MDSNLDRDILAGLGGSMNSHSLTHVIESDTPTAIDATELESEPNIIKHSSYHDFDKLVTILKGSKNRFSIFSQNIQSLNAKWNDLDIFIEMLQRHGVFFSALCLQETWLDDEVDINNYTLKNYTKILQGKHCSKAGGLAIYLHNNIAYSLKAQIKHGL